MRIFKGYAIGLGRGAVQLGREYSRRLTQVQEMHHRLGEAILLRPRLDYSALLPVPHAAPRAEVVLDPFRF